MFILFVSVVALIKNLIDLHEKGYLLKFSIQIISLVNSKWGKTLMIFLLILLIAMAAVVGTLMSELYLLNKGSVLISLIPPFALTLSTIPFSFLTYQFLYKKDKHTVI